MNLNPRTLETDLNAPNNHQNIFFYSFPSSPAHAFTPTLARFFHCSLSLSILLVKNI